jgi:hypothetical protein
MEGLREIRFLQSKCYITQKTDADFRDVPKEDMDGNQRPFLMPSYTGAVSGKTGRGS